MCIRDSFTGEYPIPLASEEERGKNLLERPASPGSTTTTAPAPDAAQPASAGASPEGADTPAPDEEPEAGQPTDGAAVDPTEDPAERPGSNGCEPGPDAELETLLTENDRTPL